ncbi:hypothetical protein [Actinoplanes sp. OR16]|uniref:hypothetical protein n=1 Tax=Actinoplanes sp. OR16 TaxID=946334 RepID=UPI001E2C6A21|nr:hypothetical protein [Actinoplanes sp. OR16]
MSERSDAPRSGGRSAPRETTGAGARGVRQNSGRSDTRRSGMRSRGEESPAARGTRLGGADGTAALALEVTDLSVTAADPAPAGRPRLWVAPPLPMRAPRATFAASVAAVVLLGVLGILLVNTKTMEQSFKLDALQKEQAVLDKKQQGLEQQLIQASNPGNIHAAARRLGLVMAKDPAMIRLPDGKISRIPTPGQGHAGVTAQSGLGSAGTPSTGAGQ